MAEHVSRRVKINVYRILVGKAKGKRLFGRHRYEGQKNIQMDLKEVCPGSWNVYQGQNKNKNVLF